MRGFKRQTFVCHGSHLSLGRDATWGGKKGGDGVGCLDLLCLYMHKHTVLNYGVVYGLGGAMFFILAYWTGSGAGRRANVGYLY